MNFFQLLNEGVTEKVSENAPYQDSGTDTSKWNAAKNSFASPKMTCPAFQIKNSY